MYSIRRTVDSNYAKPISLFASKFQRFVDGVSDSNLLFLCFRRIFIMRIPTTLNLSIKTVFFLVLAVSVRGPKTEE